MPRRLTNVLSLTAVGATGFALAAIVLSVITLSGRQSANFVPARDYRWFCDPITDVPR